MCDILQLHPDNIVLYLVTIIQGSYKDLK